MCLFMVVYECSGQCPSCVVEYVPVRCCPANQGYLVPAGECPGRMSVGFGLVADRPCHRCAPSPTWEEHLDLQVAEFWAEVAR